MTTTRSHWQVLEDRRRSRWKLHLMAAAVAALGLPPAQANPTGAQVVQGQAVIKQDGKLLTVTNSNGAIINWSQFNIAAGETTRFIQPSVSSQVLNRVLSGNPSQILGSLQSNGRVFLINPSGIVFGKGAQVDVGALVVSTLKLSDQDFTARRLEFGSLSEPGAAAQGIRNEGTIRTASGGFVYLVAPQIENSGLIHSPEGDVLLAAGHKVSLVNPRTPEVAWEVTAPDSHAVNLGDIVAKRIGMFGTQVRNAGRLQATTAVVGEDGRIVLKAQKRVEQTASGSLSAQGVDAQGRGKGGEIDIQAGDEVTLQGRIEAVAVAPVAAGVDAQTLTASTTTTTTTFSGSSGFAVQARNPAQAPSVNAGNGVRQAGQGLAPGSGQSAQGAVPSSTVAPVEAGTATAPAPEAPTAAEESLRNFAGALLPLGAGLDAALGRSQAVGKAGAGTSLPSLVRLAMGASAPAEAPVQPLPLPSPTPQPNPHNALPAGALGTGGRVRVLGRSITLGEGLLLDVSGAAGGGTMLVGGDLQGASAGGPNAQTVFVDASATLRADATFKGDGGKLIVWADDTARVHGHLSTRGGAEGGDGGFIETSGKRFLEVTQAADASASKGQAGTWLLDPYDVAIETTSSSALTGGGFTSDATTSVIGADIISAALSASTGTTNVVITTGVGGVSVGDISVNAPINKSAGGPATLTLTAHNSINLNAGITSTAGPLNLVLHADSDGNEVGDTILGNAGVNLGGGAFTAMSNGARVLLPAGNSFTLSGTDANFWRLTVGDAASVGGTLSIANGARVTVRDTFTQFGGSIGGAGVLKLSSGNHLWVGGNWGGNGLTVLAEGAFLTVGGQTTLEPLALSGRTWEIQTGTDATLSTMLAVTGGANSITVAPSGSFHFYAMPAAAPSGIDITGAGSLEFINQGLISAEGQNILQSSGSSSILSNQQNGIVKIIGYGSLLEFKRISLNQQGFIRGEFGATLKISGNSNTAPNDLLNASTGNIEGDFSIDLSPDPTYMTLGTLTNNGKIATANSSFGSGSLQVIGNLVQNPGGTLAVKLGVEISGIPYNHTISVSGAANLQGRLYLDGYFTSTVNSSSIITAGSGLNDPAASLVTSGPLNWLAYTKTDSVGSVTLPASTYLWTGSPLTSTTDWNDPNNWSQGGLPATQAPGLATDRVVIPASIHSNLDSPYLPANLVLGGISTSPGVVLQADPVSGVANLTISAGGGLGGGLNLGGLSSLTVATGVTLAVEGGYNQTGGTLAGTGTVVLKNVFGNYWGGGAWTGGGATVVAPNAALEIGDALSTGTAQLLGRAVSVEGTATLREDLSVSGTTANSFGIAPGGVLELGPTASPYVATLAVSGGSFTLVQRGALNNSAGGLGMNLTGGTTTLQGMLAVDTLSQTGGTLDGTGAITLGSPRSVTIPGQTAVTATVGGTHSINGGTLGIEYANIAGSLTIGATGAATVGNLQVAAGGSVGGTGSLTVTQGYASASGNLGSNFSNLDITQATGNLAVGNFAATNLLRLAAPTGALTDANGLGTLNLTAPSIILQARDGINLDTETGNLTVGNAGAGSSGGAAVRNTGVANLNLLGATASGNLDITNFGGGLTVTGAVSGDGDARLQATGEGNHLFVNSAYTNLSSTAGRTLKFISDGSVFFNAGNLGTVAAGASTGQALNVIVNPNHDGLGSGSAYLGTGTVIDSMGGSITIGGGASASGDAVATTDGSAGIALNGAQLSAGAGSVTLRGQGLLSGGTNSNEGVRLDASQITTTSGGINITGTGGTGNGLGNRGVAVGAGSIIQTDGAGPITLIGTAAAPAGTNFNQGISVGGTIRSTASGNISLTGAGSGSGLHNSGVGLGPGAVIETTALTGGGTITLTGTGGAGTDLNNGIGLSDTGGVLLSSASGGITLNGTAGAATGEQNRGVAIGSGNLILSTGAGNISLTGTGSSAGSNRNHGLGLSGTVRSTGSGSITLVGTGNGIGINNRGVNFNDATLESLGSGPISVTGNSLATGASGNRGIAVTSDLAGGMNNFAAGSGGIQFLGGSFLNAATLSLTAGNLNLQTGGTGLNTGILSVAGGNFSVQGPFSSTGSVNLSAGALNLNGAASLTQLSIYGGTLGGTGSLTVTSGYELTGGAVSNTLSSIDITQSLGPLTVGNLSATNLVRLRADNGAITINGAVQATGTAGLVRIGAAGGDLTLTAAGSVSANSTGDAAILATTGNFINAADGTAVAAPNGRWLIYSTDPTLDTRGGLVYGFKQYGAAFGSGTYTGLGSGNGMLYSTTPTITVGLTGLVTKVYDATTDAALAAGNYTISGTIDGDVVTLNNPSLGAYTTAGTGPGVKDVGTGKTVAVGGLALLGASKGAASVYGYQLASSTVTGAVGTISPANLTLSAVTDSKTYDGGTTSGGTVGIAGLVSGDSVSLLSQSFQSRNVLGTNASTLQVNSGYLVNDGNGGANYTVTTTTATGTITPASLTATASAPSKLYDGTTTAAPTLSITAGLVGSETLGVSATGTFNSKDVLTANLVTVNTVSLSDGTGLASNYSLAAGQTAAASITPASISLSGLAARDKVYDGTTVATLNLANVTFGGLLGGDSVSLGTSALTFSDKNVGSGKTVTVTGLSLTGPNAANYSLTGAPATLTASIAVRPLSTWTSTAGGLWSNAGNWDVLPDGANVAAVLIPAGSGTVTYDASAGLTTLQTLTDAGSLTLTGGGLVVGNTTVNTSGVLKLAGGGFQTDTLTNQGNFIIGSGIVNLAGATVLGTGTLTNEAGLFFDGTTVTNAIVNSATGQLGMTGLNALASIANSGSIEVLGGTTTLSGAFTQTASGSIGVGDSAAQTPATLQFAPGTTTIAGGTLRGVGTFIGDLQFGAAAIAPGFSPGTLNFQGNLTLSPSTTLQLELAGSNPGLFDVINVSGLATLNGAVQLSSFGGYAPLATDAFTVLNAGSTAGNFSTIASADPNLSALTLSNLQVASGGVIAPLPGTSLPPPVIPPALETPFINTIIETPVPTTPPAPPGITPPPFEASAPPPPPPPPPTSPSAPVAVTSSEASNAPAPKNELPVVSRTVVSLELDSTEVAQPTTSSTETKEVSYAPAPPPPPPAAKESGC